MLGGKRDRKLGLHGSETNGVLHFCQRWVQTRGGCLGARQTLYQNAVDSLADLVRVIKEYPRVLPPPAQQRFCDAVRLHLCIVVALGIPMRPKHHYMMEMGARPFRIA